MNMPAIRFRLGAGIFCLTFASIGLAGCGGRGGTAPSGPGVPIVQNKSIATATIVIPPKAAATARTRNPKWISPLTMAIDFASIVNGHTVAYTFTPLTPSSPNCAPGTGGLTCTVSFSVVAGIQQMVVNLYDSAIPSQAAPLAISSQTINIVGGINNPNFNFVMHAIPAAVFPSSGGIAFTAGSTGSANGVAMSVQDFDGEDLTSIPWDAPISTSLEDSTHGLSVSQPTLNGGAPIFMDFNYSGSSNTATTLMNWCSLNSTFGQAVCAAGPQPIVVDLPSRALYVANGSGAGTIEAFSPDANGNATPIRTIPVLTSSVFNAAIPIGGGGNPGGIAWKGANVIWTEPTTNSLVFQVVPGIGNTSPLTMAFFLSATSGTSTTLNHPTGVAVDTSNAVWVVNNGANAILKTNCCNNHLAINTISGAATLLNNPSGIALDSTNKIYVINNGNAILEFAANGNGNLSPVNSIAGASTGLTGAGGIAVTASTIYVTNAATNTITEYPLSASGNQAPTVTIGGAATGLAGPAAIAVDSLGLLYVANSLSNTVTVYASAANGNATPSSIIGGALTGINGPVGVVIRP